MPQERKEEMEKRRIEKKEEKKELNGFFLESSIVVPFTAHSPSLRPTKRKIFLYSCVIEALICSLNKQSNQR